MITITVNDTQVQAALARLQQRVGNMAPAMQDIGEYMVEATKARFAQSKAPDGTPWAPNKPSTLARYLGKYGSSYKKDGTLSKKGAARAGSKKPLMGETGTLSSAIYSKPGATSVMLGSAQVYSAVQQFGTRQGALGRNKRNAPLPWGDIPARPFMGVSTADSSGIVAIINDYLAQAGG